MRTRTKQKTLLTRAAATLLLAMLTTATAQADTGNEADGICYIGADGTPKNTATDGIVGNDTPTVLTTALTIEHYNTNLDGWYVVTSDQTFANGLEITGDAHVILSDGVTLRSNCGVFVTSGKSLTIYGQTAGTGHLIATTDNP